ncbi:hypothetical protein [Lentisalinibacter sediminis]|uniref:hypothetical protein n=1 Tax=Lentisalinibacter sediminis TaxID=2992237 RepID=UPI0038689883
MRPAEAEALPRELRGAVAALERTVTGQLRDELAAAGAGRGGLAEELRRRRDDYRTWHRMDEVPDRVAEVAGRLIRGEPSPGVLRQLQLAVLAAMARAHERALAESAGDG